MNNKLLQKLGEETIYSAKGHFKACDLRRNLVTITIWSCAVLNVVGIIGLGEYWDKSFSIIGLFGTIALLIWNEGEGKDYRSNHKQAGEAYLAVHKEVRELFFRDQVTPEELESINKKVRKLDKSEKPEIPHLARKWAQKAIQKYNETDNWFLDEHK